jgi:prepilin-type N-terminal cleavage/methylation domain-containing protein
MFEQNLRKDLMGHKKLPGFSLIELTLVLIVIGILTGAVFKGLELLDSAKVRATLNQIHRLRTVAVLYRETYGQWPGNDREAQNRFGDGVQNGQGNGVISSKEASQFWVHLAKAGYLSEENAPSSKLGGKFMVEGKEDAHQNVLILAGEDKTGLLTPKQAAALKAAAEDGGPSTGQVQVTEGQGNKSGSCVRGEVFNLETKTPACILVVALT